MTARVLIVDDNPTNLRLLEARLCAEYFEVVTVTSGEAALKRCAQGDIDLVLLDVMMPGLDGFETCKRLKGDPRMHHVPVLMITALDQPSDRVRGLEAGADDFITKPVDEVQLLSRVRSLCRLKALIDELRGRLGGEVEAAIDPAEPVMEDISPQNGRVLLIENDRRQAERIRSLLEPSHQVTVLPTPADAVFEIAGGSYELAIVSMDLGEYDPLRVCSQVRTLEQGRSLPLLLVAEESDRSRVARGLDLGINDFIMRPLERNELLARVKTQIRRQRYTVELRQRVSTTLALAVTDELTTLYNRRYFERHLSLLLDKAHAQARDMAIMLIDMDFFKAVNDTHGHDVGDAVLREFAGRLKRSIRGVDLACRFGGEEFVVLMPDTDYRRAQGVAERVRLAVSERGFVAREGRALPLTVSIGVAVAQSPIDTPDALIKRADLALYQAKRDGRNRVVCEAA